MKMKEFGPSWGGGGVVWGRVRVPGDPPFPVSAEFVGYYFESFYFQNDLK